MSPSELAGIYEESQRYTIGWLRNKCHAQEADAEDAFHDAWVKVLDEKTLDPSGSPTNYIRVVARSRYRDNMHRFKWGWGDKPPIVRFCSKQTEAILSTNPKVEILSFRNEVGLIGGLTSVESQWLFSRGQGNTQAQTARLLRVSKARCTFVQRKVLEKFCGSQSQSHSD